VKADGNKIIVAKFTERQTYSMA